MHPVDRSPFPAALVGVALALVTPAVAAQTSPAIDLLRSAPSVHARARAAASLGRLRPADARPALEAALEDRAPSVCVAAARALESLGDTAATSALNRHAFDRDRHTRDAVMHALQALVRRMSATSAASWTPPPAAVAGAPLPSVGALPVATPAAVNWRRVQVLITLGAINNTVSTDPAHVAHLREALRQAVSEDDRYAIHPGALPAEMTSRLRHGHLQSYSVEGTLSTLREVTAGPTVSARAEVSLILVSEPSHSIAATLSGAATAQEGRSTLPNAPDPMPRLRIRAIEGAAHGAMRSLETQLLPPASAHR